MAKQIGFLFLLLLSNALSVRGQQQIKGSGYILTQQRNVAFFNSIEVSQHIAVYIVEGHFQPITVEADDNLFPYIKTVVRNQTLKIYLPDTVDIIKFTDMNILISMPSLVSLEARQSAKIDITPELWHLNTIRIKAGSGSRIRLATQADNLNLTAQGSATIELRGNCENLTADLKTGASLYARNFEVNKAEINLSTTAKAEIKVIGKINYQIRGNSRLTLKGTPRIGQSDISSGGKIISNR